MKLAIMQPYFFPYIGYWQLISVVDTFVVYDDVNYIKGGWINRNRLLEGEKASYFNVNLKHASQNKHINEIERFQDRKQEVKFLKRITACYKKSPFFEEIYPIIETIILDSEVNLAIYLENIIKKMVKNLGIETSIIRSSDIEKNSMLRGQDKLIDICKRLKADEYYNVIGGKKLYCKKEFAENDISLFFLEPEPIVYTQFGNTFVPDLSIIDVLMFNGIEKTKLYLNRFKLL